MDVTCRVLHCSTNELVVVGAVVAREYGLPCVVNVSNATVLFSTGYQFYDVIHCLVGGTETVQVTSLRTTLASSH